MEFSWLSTGRGFCSWASRSPRRRSPHPPQHRTSSKCCSAARNAHVNPCRSRPTPPPTRASPISASGQPRPFLRRRRRSGRLLRAAVRRALLPRSSATPTRTRSRSAMHSARQPRPRCSTAARSTSPMRPTGSGYRDLDNAFVYRQKVVEGCSCNGKASFGLARIHVAADPTLRPGDVVATGDNVQAALIPMQAARERGLAAAERPAPRGSRSATPTGCRPPRRRRRERRCRPRRPTASRKTKSFAHAAREGRSPLSSRC